jgi:hypothetical protein
VSHKLLNTYAWSANLKSAGSAGAFLLATCSLAGCPDDKTGAIAPVPTATATPTGTPPPPPGPLQTPAAKNGRLKFKGGDRITADLASALALEPSAVCKEFGLYDCAGLAHKITLGGVEPYNLTVYQASTERGVSTANAVERLALSACHMRMEKDFADKGKAKLFGELVGAAPSEASLSAVASRLYLKLLGRAATTEEIQAWSVSTQMPKLRQRRTPPKTMQPTAVSPWRPRKRRSSTDPVERSLVQRLRKL